MGNEEYLLSKKWQSEERYNKHSMFIYNIKIQASKVKSMLDY
jgi:hypothetical protein